MNQHSGQSRNLLQLLNCFSELTTIRMIQYSWWRTRAVVELGDMLHRGRIGERHAPLDFIQDSIAQQQSWQSSYPDPALGVTSKPFANPTARPAAAVIPAS